MKITLLFVFLGTAIWLSGQSESPFHFEHIPGLSQNTVYSIMKDRQGFMWIATANGLNRFDGMEMKVYKPPFGNISGQMKGRIIRSGLLEDDQEQVWFATDLAINCFNKKTRKFTQQKIYFDHAKIHTGKEETPNGEMFANPLLKKENYLWFASASEGLFALNTHSGKCIYYPVSIQDDEGNNISLMYNAAYDGKDKLWFASKKGLLSFDLNKRSWNWGLKNQSFYTVSGLKDTLYLGNNDGIFWYDTKTSGWGPVTICKEPGYIVQGMIRRIYTDEKKNLWAGDQAGNIYQKSPHEKMFTWRGNINGNSLSRTNYPVYCLYADTTGNLWVGADVLGLLKTEINPNAFKIYPAEFSTGKNEQRLFIHSIYEDEDDNVWLGTFQNGVVKLNKKTRQTETIQFPYYDPALPYARSVPLVKKDRYGNLWTSNSGYLYVKERNKNKFIGIKFPVPATYLQSAQLWSIIEYDKGWLLSTNIGLYLLHKINGKYSIKLTGGFAGTRIISVWQAPDGQLWVVPETGGIYITQNIEDIQKAKRIFTDENVKAIQYDSTHQFAWISATNGLIAWHLPSEKYKLYTEEDGLLSSFVYGALFHKNEIWLSTNNGLSRGEMIYSKQSIFPRIRFTNFTTTEGLLVNEFNTGAYHQGQSGNLYFGSAGGVVWFKPEEVRSDYPSPRIRLTGFLVNEKEADSTTAPEYISSVRLQHDQNNLFFRFRGIDFNNADKVKYTYQLEGWDKNWVYSSQLNEVRYNHLPSGKYRFKVKAAGSTGSWNNEVYSVSIIILPPFWRTWWFYLLSAVIVLVSVVMITRYFAQQNLKARLAELEKQRELEKERQRISREMHDDIGAGLTQIALMSESVKNKAGISGGKELDDISDTSRQLVSSMSEIIWSLNPEQKTLDQFCAYLREQLNKQLEYSEMEFSIRLPESRNEIILSNKQRRNILLVTKEIVNNAVKYSKAKNISIEADLINDGLVFVIQDDGTGFDTARNYPGNGLKNIRSRIADMGGKMKIESVEGAGSRFEYFISLKHTI